MKTLKKRLSIRKEANQNRSKQTVNAILDATAHLLDTNSFEETSTNKIAEKAGVSIGSLYQYFPNKESIIASLIENYLKKQADELEAKIMKIETNNLEETIRQMLRIVFDSKIKYPKFNRIIAKRFASLNQLEVMLKIDDYLVEVFKRNIEPYRDQIREGNLELSLYMAVQISKLLPTAFLFSKKYSITDEQVFEENVQLIYRYIKK